MIKLEKMATENCRILTEHEKSLFFDFHTADVTKFRFIYGERKLIKEMGKYVCKVLESGSLEYFLAKEGEKVKIKGTIQTAVGLVFGKYKRIQKHVVNDDQRSTNGWKEKLFQRASAVTNEYRVKSEKTVPELTMDMIAIDSNDINNIKATVQCVFCQKHWSKLYCRPSRASCSWVFANLKTHFNSCLKDETTDPTNHLSTDSDVGEDSPTDTENLSTIELRIDPVKKLGTEQETDPILMEYINTLETQITVQGLKLANIAIQHKLIFDLETLVRPSKFPKYPEMEIA